MIKTRFCPSPTGHIHLGNARTALFSALYAMNQKGTFLLRIEDTDRARSTVELAEQLMQDLRWLDLLWQEGPHATGNAGPYWQSQRQAVYDKYYIELETKHYAYPCFCSERQLAIDRKVQLAAGHPPRYSGICRALAQEQINEKLAQGLKPTLRFRVPENECIVFEDLVRGPQKFDTNTIGDFIIRRADGTAAFFFCNALDDALMGVTHVLRGEDHLTNTPRQLFLLEALGLTPPQYGHIALIVGPDGSPLSKRHGSRSVKELRELGYLPSAVVNYLARLGHSYKEEQIEKTDLGQLSAGFSLNALGRSPARYNTAQLDYWQKQMINRLSDEEFWHWITDDAKMLIPPEQKGLFIKTIRPNVLFPADVKKWVDILFRDHIEYSDAQRDILKQAGDDFFNKAIEIVNTSAVNYVKLIELLKQQSGIKGKSLFLPLRVAMTTQEEGPEMHHLFDLIGIERLKKRFQFIIEKIMK